jgi:pimeloyl-ACP methyl ester carboxylesterase
VIPSCTRRATAPDGASLAYLRAGDGPPVLLLHGAGIVGAGWAPQIEVLQDRFTLVTLDNRGIGGSTLPPVGLGKRARLSIEAMAADALAVMDAEGLDGFHLAGHSMGGLIAQRIALDAPRRVRSLALLCTFGRGRQASRLSLAMLLTAARMRIGTRAMRRNAFLELVMPADYLRGADRVRLAQELMPLFGHDLADQPSIVLQQVRAMSRFDVRSDLASLGRIPTLVVSARHDRIALPVYGRSLAAAIPDARYLEFEEAGHGVTIQCAAAINSLLAEHWSRADVGEGARRAASTGANRLPASAPATGRA